MQALARPLLSGVVMLAAALALGAPLPARAEASAPIVVMDSAPPGTAEQSMQREQERLERRFHVRQKHGIRRNGSPPAARAQRGRSAAPPPSIRDASSANQPMAAALP